MTLGFGFICSCVRCRLTMSSCPFVFQEQEYKVLEQEHEKYSNKLEEPPTNGDPTTSIAGCDASCSIPAAQSDIL